MSYNQAIKHFKNHKKDKFYQQCSFSFSDENIKSIAVIAEQTAEKYVLKNIKTREIISGYFYSEDDAVDFYMSIENNADIGIYTDKGFCIAK